MTGTDFEDIECSVTVDGADDVARSLPVTDALVGVTLGD